ncbi:MAG: hypothetical protein BroJett002_37130 [Candidatus Brocadia sinica]|nr:MAG: hypothetical protein BroJett002_37130 [Candidatus Brocadia sinica]
MIYLYTNSNCPKCEKLKEKYRLENTQYVERDASRIKTPEDEIDREALIQASLQNMELPVIIDMDKDVKNIAKEYFQDILEESECGANCQI